MMSEALKYELEPLNWEQRLDGVEKEAAQGRSELATLLRQVRLLAERLEGAEQTIRHHDFELGYIKREYAIGDDRRIEEIWLSNRTVDRLQRHARTSTVGQLIRYTPENLLRLPKFGPQALKEVVSNLKYVGLTLSRVGAPCQACHKSTPRKGGLWQGGYLYCGAECAQAKQR